MTNSTNTVPLEDAELASIAGGLWPVVVIATTAAITTVVKDFVEHVGDFTEGVMDGWTVAMS